MGRHGWCGKQSLKSGLILVPVGSAYRFLARPPRAIDLHPQSCAPQAKGGQGTRLDFMIWALIQQ